MQKRKASSREFKLEAVRLPEQGEKSAVEVVRELGIKHNPLYKWKEQPTEKGEAAFPGRVFAAGPGADIDLTLLLRAC